MQGQPEGALAVVCAGLVLRTIACVELHLALLPREAACLVCLRGFDVLRRIVTQLLATAAELQLALPEELTLELAVKQYQAHPTSSRVLIAKKLKSC